MSGESLPGIKKNTSPETEPELDIKERVDVLDEDQLETAWDVEVQHWGQLGLNPMTSVHVDMFHLKFRFDMLQAFIKDNVPGYDESEFDLRVKRAMLVAMINLRQQHERMLLHAKLTEGIQGPQVQVPIVPPGIKM